MSNKLGRRGFLASLAAALAVRPASAAGHYDPGADDSQIKIGQTMPYSGPVSSIGTIGRAMVAYFAKVNAEGGINGRKIDLISLDDGYSPPKTVEQTRRLVEQDQVLLIFGTLGTAPNAAIRKYLNGRKVPQLFVTSGASDDNNPAHYPWTMAWLPSYALEGRIYGKYIQRERPAARIGVLYQHDDFGRDYMEGFVEGLGPNAGRLIVDRLAYEVTDPTVESQLITLQSRGVDTLFAIATPKFAAQTIRAVRELHWDPLLLIPTVATSVVGVLKPAGFDNAKGVISATFLKDPTDSAWEDDSGYREFRAWMEKHFPEGDPANRSNVSGYTAAQMLVEVLKRCGDNLTRANVMKQSANLHGVWLPMLLPGIAVNTDPSHYSPIRQMQLERFDGKSWVRFGDLISA